MACRWGRNASPPPQSMGSVYSGLMQGVGAAEKVFEFIDRQPTMVHDGKLAPDHLVGRVDFENVTFTYRTRPHTQVLQVRGARGLPRSSFPSSHPSAPNPGQALAVWPGTRKASPCPGAVWAPVGISARKAIDQGGVTGAVCRDGVNSQGGLLGGGDI